VGRLAAAGAVGLMAAAPFYWALSLVAEVYTLHVVMMAGLILLLLRWADEPTTGRLALAAVWTGLSFSHHLATALLVPGITYFVLSRAGRDVLQPKTLALTAGAVLAGLSVYVYLPFLYSVEPAFNYVGRFDSGLDFHPVDLTRPAGMWALVTGRTFASRMFAYRGSALWWEVVWFAGHLARAFLFVGIGPGLLGWFHLMNRNRRLAAALGLMFAASAFFYIDYAVVDKETMFLPTYLLWAIFVGLGYQALEDRVNDGDPAWIRTSLRTAILGSVVLAVGVTAPKVDLSGDWSTRQRAEAVMETVGPDAVIFGWWDTIPPIQYLQLVEGRRPDVQAVNRFLISRTNIYTFVLEEAGRRPIYIDTVPEEWVDDFEIEMVGGLFRLEPAGEANYGNWPIEK
jgi:hypothetical protein